MLRWKIEVDKAQGRFRPYIHIYAWIEGQLPNGSPEHENPLHIDTKFLLPILRLPMWKEKTKKEKFAFQRYPVLPFNLWDNADLNDYTLPYYEKEGIEYYGIIGGHRANFFSDTPQLLKYYFLDWIPDATPETYEPIIQAFIEHWLTPLQQEYERRLTEAINSQAIKIIKTNDNNNDNNNNNQFKVTRKIKT